MQKTLQHEDKDKSIENILSLKKKVCSLQAGTYREKIKQKKKKESTASQYICDEVH